MVRTLVSIVALLLVLGCDEPDAPTAAARPPSPASRPSSAPATTQAMTPPVLTTLLDVVRARDPQFPTTRPLDEPLELPAAARLRFDEPTYLCSRGDVWLTRPDAPLTPVVLAAAPRSQTHVARETVRFVYWRPVDGSWTAEVVAEDESTSADLWITAAARWPLEGSLARDWARAGVWNTDAIQAAVVPTSTGVSVIRVADGKVDERHVALLAAVSPGSSTHYALDPRGLLAWSVDPAGTSKVARFIDGQWTMLTSDDAPNDAWPARLLHVVPLLDGTVLAVGESDGTLRLKSVLVEAIPIDEAVVLDLVKRLSNRNVEQRESAQDDLARLGSAAWPILRRLAPTQPPEARLRIRALLGNETTPTLGGITPDAGPSKLVARLPDGGVVLRFDAGASAVSPNGVVQHFAPAWIAVRPGAGTRRVPDAVTEQLRATPAAKLTANDDEWIVEHDVDGPKRWLGNHAEALLTPKEAAEFKRFAGIDAVGRWLFRTDQVAGPTLVIDPTLPDPRPRLPIWTIDMSRSGGAAGWTADDWAVRKSAGAWMLKKASWAVLSADTPFATTLDTPPPPTTTTGPTTTQATKPLLIDADGNRYFDGRESLVVETPDGRHLAWPLPPEQSGPGAIAGEPVLIEADGKLFLCNADGRIARIAKQFDQSEPFKVEATFTRNVPATDVRRIWKDPAGRLVIASGGNRLSVAFPSGRIPGDVSNMIPAGALREALVEDGAEPVGGLPP